MIAPSAALARVVLAAFILIPGRSSAQAVVTGPAADRRLDWRLERVWHIGGGEDESLLLSTIFDKDLATDQRGRLYVVDRTESRVVQYDSTGEARRSFGAKGMGPGELTAPLWVDVRTDGRVLVGDAEKGTVVVFSAEGVAEPELRMVPRLRSPRALSNTSFVGISTRGGDSVALVVSARGSTNALVRIAAARTRSTPPVCRLTDYPVPPLFAPQIVWAARGNRIVASTGAFELRVFDGETLQRILTRGTPVRSSSRALARQHLGPGETVQILGLPACTVPADLILSVAEIAPTLPAYSAITIAPDQHIWATRFTVRGEPGLADIYHPTRGYVGSVTLGSARPAAFLANGLLISIEHDVDAVPIIVAYRVRGM